MKLNALTSLRFFAALAVFLHHFHFFQHTTSPELKSLYGAFFEGFAGVTFFYVLSGFIISYSYHAQATNRAYTAGEFLFNRFARLYPVHFLTLGTAIAAYVGFDNLSLIDGKVLAANAFLVQSYIPDSSYFFSFNGVAWSISAELFFYVAFIAALVKLRTRTLAVIAVAMAALIGYLIKSPLQYNSAYNWIFYINPAFRVIDFISGMLVFRLFMSGKFRISEGQGTFAEIASLALLGIFGYIGLNGVSMLWRFDLFYLLPMAIVVWVFAQGQGVISKMISHRLFVTLGEASFSLYMIHQIVITIALSHMPVDINQPRQVYWFIGSTVLIGIVGSVALYLYYEKPINDLLRRMRKTRSSKYQLTTDN
jgi:peptidoglycan/LPS O-acetylase OafA/YrhL